MKHFWKCIDCLHFIALQIFALVILTLEKIKVIIIQYLYLLDNEYLFSMQELKAGDIVLVLFSKFHMDTLLEVVPKTKIVCMDGTHGTNGYAYHLITH